MDRDIDVVERGELHETLEKMADPRDQALIATMYLLGARVGELVEKHPLRKCDIEELKDRYVFTVFTEKRRSSRNAERRVPVPKDEFFLSYLHKWLEINRELPDDFPIFYSYGRWGSERMKPSRPLDRSNAWRVIKRANPRLWLHLLRHSRFTEVAPRMMPFDLKSMAGWTTMAPINTYVHLMESAYARKIKPWKPVGEKVDVSENRVGETEET